MELSELTKTGIHFITEPISVPDGTYLRAEPGCRLVGGTKLSAVPLENGLWMCDLAAAGVDPAPFISRGFGKRISPAHNGLYLNGKPLSLSRYPKNDGFLTITAIGTVPHEDGTIAEGKMEDGFFYDDGTLGTWLPGQEIWMLGYWARDWAPTRERLGSIDAERRFVSLDVAPGWNHIRERQRFCFYNIREEVTEPGDYCIDFAERKLYFRPFSDTDMECAELLLSVSGKPAFALDGAKDIVLDGFTIEAFRGMGVTVRNSERVILRNCTLRNIGNRAVCVDDSTEVTVTRCHVYNTGDGGVAYYCGDRKTLANADCSVTYSRFHDIAMWDRCYEPPIRLYGVGLSAHHNVIYDCPHAAVLFGGNDISITDNEIFRVVTETGDAGAIYGGRDYTFRGNEVSRNFLHHIGSGIGMGTMGIYNDDALSGTKMRDNVFFRVQRAVFLGGGVDFLAEGNVFVECTPAVSIDGRGQSDDPMWRNMVMVTLRDNFNHIAGSDVSGMSPEYLRRYPELAKIDKYYRESPEPHIPPSAVIRHNYFCSTEKIDYSWATDGGFFTEYDNIDISREELPAYLTQHECDVILGDETTA